MKIFWTPLALQRVGDVVDYIARDNPDAAKRWVEAIFHVVERLNQFPGSGRVVPEVGRQTIREIKYGRYRILYRVAKNKIGILTVRHDRQFFNEDEVEEK